MEFDRYSSDYRQIHNENIGKISGTDSNYFSEYKIKELFDRGLRIADGGIWLDVGCGDGNTAQYVNKYYPGCKYIGIDVSEYSINEAKKNNERIDAKFLIYDGMNMPFEENSVDIVFMATVMHHISMDNRHKILSEILKILKPGGWFVVFEHNPFNPLTRRCVNTCIFDADAKLLSARKLKKILPKDGFTKPVVRYTIFFPRKQFFNMFIPIEKKMGFLPVGGQYFTMVQKRK